MIYTEVALARRRAWAFICTTTLFVGIVGWLFSDRIQAKADARLRWQIECLTSGKSEALCNALYAAKRLGNNFN